MSRATLVWVAPDLPDTLKASIVAWLDARPEPWLPGSSPAGVGVDWERRPGARPVATFFVVPAVPLASPREDLALADLRRTWRGDAPGQLLVTPASAAALDALLGARAAQAPVEIVSAGDLLPRLTQQPEATAVLPFDELSPQLKPLSVDGLSVLDRGLGEEEYPLQAVIWARGPGGWEDELATGLEEQHQSSNRRLDRLTILAMTGVTALARGVALEIEARGDPGWPARGLAGLLSAADLTHVSNEVSFMPGCQAREETPAFCSRPAYMEVLRLVGADLVELTGNHNLDFGAPYALQSLDLYAAEGMATFGGGRDAAAAYRPLFMTHNGNRLAFLGYNQFGPDYALAGPTAPGAAPFSLAAAQAGVAEARAQADLVFVNVQYTEAYQAVPLPEQMADFRAIVDAGADVVTGTQAHQPQIVELYQGKPIFYGLGNLFFDQTWSPATRQSLIVRHYIYQGRMLSVEILPTTMGDDCQPVLATGQERDEILRTVLPVQ
jgi:poly-gamma-glutamate synthesis protein (capsule biosynthesis protein)